MRIIDQVAKRPIYLYNYLEDCYVRTKPGGFYYAKFPGGKEYRLDRTTKMVTDALLGSIEVTKAQYDKALLLDFDNKGQLKR